MTIRRLRHILKPPLLSPKSKKANSQSASRAGIVTKPISSLSHCSRVWFAGEAPLTPTIYGSLSPARWGAKSATNSLYLCAERITGTTIGSETKSPGGRDGLLIPSPCRGCSGSQRGEPPKVYVLEKSESHARASPGFLEKIADDPTAQFIAFLARSTLLLWWATWRIGVRQSKETIILQRAYVSVEPLGVHFGNVQ
jgi:hypothetical protein